MKKHVLTTLIVATLWGCNDNESYTITLPTVPERSEVRIESCPEAETEQQFTCGKLSVPENRFDKNSALVEIPFVVLRAANAGIASTELRDPILFIGGGPGPSSVETALNLPAEILNQLPLRQNHDLVFFDQRGSSSASENLYCEELEIDPIAGKLFSSTKEVVDAAIACKTRLQKDGVNLNLYGSAEIAQDAYELTQLLAKEASWSLVSTSYGTRVAEQFIKQYGSSKVRALVLDGPLPLATSALYDANTLESIDSILKLCTKFTMCRDKSGAEDLKSVKAGFIASLNDLSTSPRTTKTGQQIGLNEVLKFYQSVLTSGQVDLLLPFTEAMTREQPDEALTLIDLSGFSLLAPATDALYYSVICRDEAVTEQLPELTKAAGWPDPLRKAAAESLNPLTLAVCKEWNKTEKVVIDPIKFTSTVPTLITVGEFDPVTPFSNAAVSRQTFINAIEVKAPGAGHGLMETDACAQQTAVAFIENPETKTPSSCWK